MRSNPLADAVADVERTLIEQALRHGGSISAAARALGIDRNTLERKLRRYGVEAKSARASS